jgi:hypothetical protein
MQRLTRSWLTVGVVAALVGCDSSQPSATDALGTKDTTPGRRDAKVDAIDCSLVGCAAPPPCGQPCTAPCGCCTNPACFVDARPGDRPRAEAGRDLGAKADLVAKTSCGPSLACAAATEICVESGPVGPGSTFACKPVPAGCTANRTCACVGGTLCTGAFDTCHDVNTPNTIYCECPACQ